MGLPENKVCLPIQERAIIEHTLLAFVRHSYVDELILAVREEERGEMERIAAEQGKSVRVVIGGATRQASVYAAIVDLGSEIVLVHDGARPFVSEACITACVEAMDQYDGAIPALLVEGQICNVGSGRKKKRQPKPEFLRGSLYGAETPQCFHTKILKRCHERHKDSPLATDDSSLLELEGYRVGVVSGDLRNIKITTPLDLLVAEAYFGERE